MDFQTVFNLVVIVGLPAMGWAMRTIFEDIRNLNEKIAEHQVMVARDYATNSDLGRIEAKLDRILERIDRKADRHDHH
jgi:hypothetical protein